VRGVNKTVTRHKMTNSSFFLPMKTCVPRVANMIINYIFSTHLQFPAPRKTRPYVSGFSLGCCDHMWAKWKLTIINPS
jgi:hypothetical protein